MKQQCDIIIITGNRGRICWIRRRCDMEWMNREGDSRQSRLWNTHPFRVPNVYSKLSGFDSASRVWFCRWITENLVWVLFTVFIHFLFRIKKHAIPDFRPVNCAEETWSVPCMAGCPDLTDHIHQSIFITVNEYVRYFLNISLLPLLPDLVPASAVIMGISRRESQFHCFPCLHTQASAHLLSPCPEE